MKVKGMKILCVFLGVGILFFMGCAAPKPAPPVRPAWVDKGGGAFDMDKGKVFYGVGMASGIKNPALLRRAADSSARADIASTLETYVARLTKAYMASTTAGDMSASSEEQHVEEALKTFTKATLHGTRIINHWKDPVDGTLYSLCELDLLAFKEALDEYKELDEKVRDYVRENAEKMHKQLEDME